MTNMRELTLQSKTFQSLKGEFYFADVVVFLFFILKGSDASTQRLGSGFGYPTESNYALQQGRYPRSSPRR